MVKGGFSNVEKADCPSSLHACGDVGSSEGSVAAAVDAGAPDCVTAPSLLDQAVLTMVIGRCGRPVVSVHVSFHV